jgi:hypothetical protein
MEKTSVGTFKTMVGVFALLFILIAGAVVVVALRKPAATRPTRANKPQERLTLALRR